MEGRFPVRQKELEVGRSQICDGPRSQPSREAAQRVRILLASRGSASTPTEVAVEAQEKRRHGSGVMLKTTHFVDSIITSRIAFRRRPYACSRWGVRVSQDSPRSLSYSA